MKDHSSSKEDSILDKCCNEFNTTCKKYDILLSDFLEIKSELLKNHSLILNKICEYKIKFIKSSEESELKLYEELVKKYEKLKTDIEKYLN